MTFALNLLPANIDIERLLYLLAQIGYRIVVAFNQMENVFVLGEIMNVLGEFPELEWLFLRLDGHKKQVSAGFALK